MEETYVPITNTEIPCWEAMLPAVLVVFSVENLLFVLLWGNVALPLLLTVTVLPAHPAVKVHLRSTTDIRPVSRGCLWDPHTPSGHQADWKPPNRRPTLLSGSRSTGGAGQEHKSQHQKENQGKDASTGRRARTQAAGHGQCIQPGVQEVSSKEADGTGVQTRMFAGRTRSPAQTRLLGRSATMRKKAERTWKPRARQVERGGRAVLRSVHGPLLRIDQDLCQVPGKCPEGKTLPWGTDPEEHSVMVGGKC